MHRSRCCRHNGLGRYPSGNWPCLPPPAITPPAEECGRATAGATMKQAKTAASASPAASLPTGSRDPIADSIIAWRFEERTGLEPRTREGPP